MVGDRQIVVLKRLSFLCIYLEQIVFSEGSNIGTSILAEDSKDIALVWCGVKTGGWILPLGPPLCNMTEGQMIGNSSHLCLLFFKN